jgi:hypothetical protein
MPSFLTLLLVGRLVLPSVALEPNGPIASALAAHAARLAATTTEGDAAGQTDNAVELRWSELGPVVAGHRVTAVLADGSRVTGEAVVVRDDALVLNVRRSTGTQAYAGGNAPIPRSAVARLEVEKHGGAGRTLGIVLGVLTGVVLGGWISAETTDSAGAGIPLFLGVASGITLAGYYAGKSLSRQVTVIRIVP